MLQHAFKEWAVICRALAEGKQAILLRKGGIAEVEGKLRLEHTRFWLYPTYTHQQRDGVRAEAMPWLDVEEKSRPAPGTLRLSHWAEVTGVYQVRDLTLALLLAHLHYWSDDTVRKRFAYRAPGIQVWTVRVYRAAQVHEVAELPGYEGCMSWVELEQGLSTDASTPVLADADYRDVQMSLDMLLCPTATV